MNNMAAQRRASRRKGCRRNNQKGGAGEAYTFGSHVAGSPIINNYGQEVVRFPSCEGGVRPGYIDDAQIKGGLPGFAQRGGRYTNEFNVVNGVGMMEPTYSGCGTGMEAISNPLNKGDLSSLITAPAPAAQKGGRHRKYRKTRKTNQYGGVGGVDSMVYSAPRAGWTTFPSNAQGGDAGTLADGKTPFLINVPFSAQPTPSLACLKTGGGSRKRRSKKASKKSRKASKKSRKASKKSRKASKKSRRVSKKSRKACRKNRK